MYAGPFLVLWGGLFLSDAFERARKASGRVRIRRLAVAGLLLAVAVAPVIATLPPGYPTAVPEELIGELRSLREHASGRAPRAVMAPWQLGHAIQYYSGLPVVATPFGTDLGPDGMRDLAAFYYAPDPAAAEELLRRRGVGYVLLQNPYEDVASAFELAPAGTPPVLRIERDWVNGPRLRDLPAARNNLPGWLWQLTGTPRPGTREALEGYRLLHETPGGREKLFEVVDGARLQYTGASPGQPVVASTTLVTNQGRSVSWSTASKPGPDGSGTLRLPYATGANGDVQAGPVVIRSGSVSVQLAVPPEAVLAGATSTLRLDAPGTTR
jgi:asparagine N-glycosylation enzyme membrane subunit Stt3